MMRMKMEEEKLSKLNEIEMLKIKEQEQSQRALFEKEKIMMEKNLDTIKKARDHEMNMIRELEMAQHPETFAPIVKAMKHDITLFEEEVRLMKAMEEEMYAADKKKFEQLKELRPKVEEADKLLMEMPKVDFPAAPKDFMMHHD